METINNVWFFSVLESAFLEKYDAVLYDYELDELQTDPEIYLTGVAEIEYDASGTNMVTFSISYKCEIFCAKLETQEYFDSINKPVNEFFDKYTEKEGE